MKMPLYFDYAATTPMDPAVATCMSEYLTLEGIFGNPASRSHRYGWQAEEAVDEAREHIANLINADPREIVFTSGATESDNLAIKGVAEYRRLHSQDNESVRERIVTLRTEHKAVLDTCADIEQRGFSVTYLDVEADGRLNLTLLQEALGDDVALVSIMHVNNETGVIQDIADIARLTHQCGALLHVDAAQSVGKVEVDVRELDIDLLSISAHKMYGPKGIGALYVRRQPRVRLHAQVHGGGHERGMRSGTLATHQIAGFGKAAQIAIDHLAEEKQRLGELRQQLWQGLLSIGGVSLNGSYEYSAPGILNVAFDKVDGEMLLVGLRDLAVSTGSACNSASVEPSYVLRAMGLDREQAHSSIRFSIGRFTDREQIDACIALVRRHVEQLRAQPQVW